MPGLWPRLLRWVGSSDEELGAEDAAERSRGTGAQPISSARARERVHLRGSLQSIRYTSTARRLEAELSDGTGAVTVIWMGRQTIPGLVAGRVLEIRGTLTVSDGRRVIFNPAYEIVLG
ncbi:MAG: DNA-binding protein [Actinomycetia bacterium]|nr:DNA-binding protein [Actinomycetes bacterium]